MKIDHLTSEQKNMVLGFLLARMGMGTRHALMATLPLAYVTMYPTAKDSVIEIVRTTVMGEVDSDV